jgi:AsmA-like C-terminal region
VTRGLPPGIEGIATLRRRILIGALGGGAAVLAALALTSAYLLNPAHLQGAAARALSQRLHLDVAVGSVSLHVFPRPRLEGGGVTVRIPGRPDLPPFVSIDHFSMGVGLLSALRRHVALVQVDGLKIAVPPSDARRDLPRAPGGAARVVIDRLVSHDAELRILPRTPGSTPLTFAIHDLEIQGVGVGRSMPFHAALTNPVPEGLVDTTGTVGPLDPGDPADLPVRGTYSFTDADLSTINGIGGTLSSTGHYEGRLTSIRAAGTTRTPDFNLDLGGRPKVLDASYEAVIDGTDGTTRLEKVDATLGRTHISVTGAIRNLAGPGRHDVDLHATIQDGRIEDLVGLAVDSPHPILTGDVTLRTDLSLPPGESRVRDRLRVEGAFGLGGATFDPEVQKKVRDLSRRSQGKDKDEAMGRVVSELQGRFSLSSGILRLSDLSFQVPGASVSLAGTYTLATGALDFRGKLRMQATVSQAVGGFKSIFLKPFDALFRKKGAGAVLPIKITGTRQHPDFGVDVGRIIRTPDR